MTLSLPFLSRRAALQSAAAAILATTGSAWGQPGRAPARALAVAQIVDASNEQQDISRDFLVGSRAAWQDINSHGGLRGRPVQHLVIEVDGSAASIKTALQSLRDNPACVALAGTVSDPVAAQLMALLHQEALPIAHVAPWLQSSSQEIDERTFPIFAARQEQIAHALKSLSATGAQEVGAVFASRREHELYREDAARIASNLNLKLRSYPGNVPLAQLGQQMDQSTPAVLLFIGGTPELVQFTLGLGKQSRQRYVVALADVNLQTVLQMGGARTTPVIVTQAVPMVTAASVPIVRRYREVLARLFDEPPVPLSLAGFIAARYAFEVLAEVDGPLTRASALAAFQKRSALDLGGYRIAFDASRRSASYVTQSMLTADGRVVG